MLSVDGGELTPTMKVKRNVINEKYGAVIEGMYRSDTASPSPGPPSAEAAH